jgi:predicted SAM-dependent methyltransferase
MEHALKKIKMLNLGCGNRYHNEWTNIDFHSTGINVIAHNLRKGIPFPDNIFDIVYHSHVIEHFSKEEAPKLITECYRVLKPDGIIRVAFPDLEAIAKHYLRLLNELRNNNLQYEDDYNWIMLEMYDQTVRNVSGGEMSKYLTQKFISNEKFIIERMGILKEEEKRKQNNVISALKFLKRKIFNIFEKKFGNMYQASKIGHFRLGGEIHQWMYDTYSLSRLLKSVGFKDVIVRDAFTSYISNWEKYNLDTNSDGHIYKPDSNYIEGIK